MIRRRVPEVQTGEDASLFAERAKLRDRGCWNWPLILEGRPFGCMLLPCGRLDVLLVHRRSVQLLGPAGSRIQKARCSRTMRLGLRVAASRSSVRRKGGIRTTRHERRARVGFSGARGFARRLTNAGRRKDAKRSSPLLPPRPTVAAAASRCRLAKMKGCFDMKCIRVQPRPLRVAFSRPTDEAQAEPRRERKLSETGSW